MIELLKLIIRYAEGLMSYEEFRSDFVLRFLAAHDESISRAVAMIECLCADDLDSSMTESQFKQQLVDVFRPQSEPIITTGSDVQVTVLH